MTVSTASYTDNLFEEYELKTPIGLTLTAGSALPSLLTLSGAELNSRYGAFTASISGGDSGRAGEVLIAPDGLLYTLTLANPQTTRAQVTLASRGADTSVTVGGRKTTVQAGDFLSPVLDFGETLTVTPRPSPWLFTTRITAYSAATVTIENAVSIRALATAQLQSRELIIAGTPNTYEQLQSFAPGAGGNITGSVTVSVLLDTGGAEVTLTARGAEFARPGGITANVTTTMRMILGAGGEFYNILMTGVMTLDSQGRGMFTMRQGNVADARNVVAVSETRSTSPGRAPRTFTLEADIIREFSWPVFAGARNPLRVWCDSNTFTGQRTRNQCIGAGQNLIVSIHDPSYTRGTLPLLTVTTAVHNGAFTVTAGGTPYSVAGLRARQVSVLRAADFEGVTITQIVPGSIPSAPVVSVNYGNVQDGITSFVTLPGDALTVYEDTRFVDVLDGAYLRTVSVTVLGEPPQYAPLTRVMAVLLTVRAGTAIIGGQTTRDLTFVNNRNGENAFVRAGANIVASTIQVQTRQTRLVTIYSQRIAAVVSATVYERSSSVYAGLERRAVTVEREVLFTASAQTVTLTTAFRGDASQEPRLTAIVTVRSVTLHLPQPQTITGFLQGLQVVTVDAVEAVLADGGIGARFDRSFNGGNPYTLRGNAVDGNLTAFVTLNFVDNVGGVVISAQITQLARAANLVGLSQQSVLVYRPNTPRSVTTYALQITTTVQLTGNLTTVDVTVQTRDGRQVTVTILNGRGTGSREFRGGQNADYFARGGAFEVAVPTLTIGVPVRLWTVTAVNVADVSLRFGRNVGSANLAFDLEGRAVTTRGRVQVPLTNGGATLTVTDEQVRNMLGAAVEGITVDDAAAAVMRVTTGAHFTIQFSFVGQPYLVTNELPITVTLDGDNVRANHAVLTLNNHNWSTIPAHLQNFIVLPNNLGIGVGTRASPLNLAANYTISIVINDDIRRLQGVSVIAPLTTGAGRQTIDLLTQVVTRARIVENGVPTVTVSARFTVQFLFAGLPYDVINDVALPLTIARGNVRGDYAVVTLRNVNWSTLPAAQRRFRVLPNNLGIGVGQLASPLNIAADYTVTIARTPEVDKLVRTPVTVAEGNFVFADSQGRTLSSYVGVAVTVPTFADDAAQIVIVTSEVGLRSLLVRRQGDTTVSVVGTGNEDYIVGALTVEGEVTAGQNVTLTTEVAATRTFAAVLTNITDTQVNGGLSVASVNLRFRADGQDVQTEGKVLATLNFGETQEYTDAQLRGLLGAQTLSVSVVGNSVLSVTTGAHFTIQFSFAGAPYLVTNEFPITVTLGRDNVRANHAVLTLNNHNWAAVPAHLRSYRVLPNNLGIGVGTQASPLNLAANYTISIVLNDAIRSLQGLSLISPLTGSVEVYNTIRAAHLPSGFLPTLTLTTQTLTRVAFGEGLSVTVVSAQLTLLSGGRTIVTDGKVRITLKRAGVPPGQTLSGRDIRGELLQSGDDGRGFDPADGEAVDVLFAPGVTMPALRVTPPLSVLGTVYVAEYDSGIGAGVVARGALTATVLSGAAIPVSVTARVGGSITIVSSNNPIFPLGETYRVQAESEHAFTTPSAVSLLVEGDAAALEGITATPGVLTFLQGEGITITSAAQLQAGYTPTLTAAAQSITVTSAAQLEVLGAAPTLTINVHTLLVSGIANAAGFGVLQGRVGGFRLTLRGDQTAQSLTTTLAVSVLRHRTTERWITTYAPPGLVGFNIDMHHGPRQGIVFTLTTELPAAANIASAVTVGEYAPVVGNFRRSVTVFAAPLNVNERVITTAFAQLTILFDGATLSTYGRVSVTLGDGGGVLLAGRNLAREFNANDELPLVAVVGENRDEVLFNSEHNVAPTLAVDVVTNTVTINGEEFAQARRDYMRVIRGYSLRAGESLRANDLVQLTGFVPSVNAAGTVYLAPVFFRHPHPNGELARTGNNRYVTIVHGSSAPTVVIGDLRARFNNFNYLDGTFGGPIPAGLNDIVVTVDTASAYYAPGAPRMTLVDRYITAPTLTAFVNYQSLQNAQVRTVESAVIVEGITVTTGVSAYAPQDGVTLPPNAGAEYTPTLSITAAAQSITITSAEQLAMAGVAPTLTINVHTLLVSGIANAAGFGVLQGRVGGFRLTLRGDQTAQSLTTTLAVSVLRHRTTERWITTYAPPGLVGFNIDMHHGPRQGIVFTLTTELPSAANIASAVTLGSFAPRTTLGTYRPGVTVLGAVLETADTLTVVAPLSVEVVSGYRLVTIGRQTLYDESRLVTATVSRDSLRALLTLPPPASVQELYLATTTTRITVGEIRRATLTVTSAPQWREVLPTNTVTLVSNVGEITATTDGAVLRGEWADTFIPTLTITSSFFPGGRLVSVASLTTRFDFATARVISVSVAVSRNNVNAASPGLGAGQFYVPTVTNAVVALLATTRLLGSDLESFDRIRVTLPAGQALAQQTLAYTGAQLAAFVSDGRFSFGNNNIHILGTDPNTYMLTTNINSAMTVSTLTVGRVETHTTMTTTVDIGEPVFVDLGIHEYVFLTLSDDARIVNGTVRVTQIVDFGGIPAQNFNGTIIATSANTVIASYGYETVVREVTTQEFSEMRARIGFEFESAGGYRVAVTTFQSVTVRDISRAGDYFVNVPGGVVDFEDLLGAGRSTARIIGGNAPTGNEYAIGNVITLTNNTPVSTAGSYRILADERVTLQTLTAATTSTLTVSVLRQLPPQNTHNIYTLSFAESQLTPAVRTLTLGQRVPRFVTAPRTLTGYTFGSTASAIVSAHVLYGFVVGGNATPVVISSRGRLLATISLGNAGQSVTVAYPAGLDVSTRLAADRNNGHEGIVVSSPFGAGSPFETSFGVGRTVAFTDSSNPFTLVMLPHNRQILGSHPPEVIQVPVMRDGARVEVLQTMIVTQSVTLQAGVHDELTVNIRSLPEHAEISAVITVSNSGLFTVSGQTVQITYYSEYTVSLDSRFLGNNPSANPNCGSYTQGPAEFLQASGTPSRLFPTEDPAAHSVYVQACITAAKIMHANPMVSHLTVGSPITPPPNTRILATIPLTEINTPRMPIFSVTTAARFTTRFLLAGGAVTIVARTDDNARFSLTITRDTDVRGDYAVMTIRNWDFAALQSGQNRLRVVESNNATFAPGDIVGVPTAPQDYTLTVALNNDIRSLSERGFAGTVTLQPTYGQVTTVTDVRHVYTIGREQVSAGVTSTVAHSVTLASPDAPLPVFAAAPVSLVTAASFTTRFLLAGGAANILARTDDNARFMLTLTRHIAVGDTYAVITIANWDFAALQSGQNRLRVVESNNATFAPGDIVGAPSAPQDYTLTIALSDEIRSLNSVYVGDFAISHLEVDRVTTQTVITDPSTVRQVVYGFRGLTTRTTGSVTLTSGFALSATNTVTNAVLDTVRYDLDLLRTVTVDAEIAGRFSLTVTARRGDVVTSSLGVTSRLQEGKTLTAIYRDFTRPLPPDPAPPGGVVEITIPPDFITSPPQGSQLHQFARITTLLETPAGSRRLVTLFAHVVNQVTISDGDVSVTTTIPEIPEVIDEVQPDGNIVQVTIRRHTLAILGGGAGIPQTLTDSRGVPPRTVTVTGGVAAPGLNGYTLSYVTLSTRNGVGGQFRISVTLRGFTGPNTATFERYTVATRTLNAAQTVATEYIVTLLTMTTYSLSISGMDGARFISAVLEPGTFEDILGGTLSLRLPEHPEQPEADKYEYITIDELAGQRALSIIGEGDGKGNIHNEVNGALGVGVVDLLDFHYNKFGVLPEPAIFAAGAAEERHRPGGAPALGTTSYTTVTYARFEGRGPLTRINVTTYSARYDEVAVGTRVNRVYRGTDTNVVSYETNLGNRYSQNNERNIYPGLARIVKTDTGGGALLSMVLPLSDLPPVYLVNDVTVNARPMMASGATRILPPYNAAMANLQTRLNDNTVASSFPLFNTDHYPSVGLFGLDAALVSVGGTPIGSAIRVSRATPTGLSGVQTIVVVLAENAYGYYQKSGLVNAAQFADESVSAAAVKALMPHAVKGMLPAGTRLTLESSGLMIQIPAGVQALAMGANAVIPGGGVGAFAIFAGPNVSGSTILLKANGVANDAPAAAGDMGFLPLESQNIRVIRHGAKVTLGNAGAVSELGHPVTIRLRHEQTVVPMPPPGRPHIGYSVAKMQSYRTSVLPGRAGYSQQLATVASFISRTTTTISAATRLPTPIVYPAWRTFVLPVGSRIMHPGGGVVDVGAGFRFAPDTFVYMPPGAVIQGAQLPANAVLPSGAALGNAAAQTNRRVTMHAGAMMKLDMAQLVVSDGDVVKHPVEMFDIELRDIAMVQNDNPLPRFAILQPYSGRAIVDVGPFRIPDDSLLFWRSQQRANFLTRTRFLELSDVKVAEPVGFGTHIQLHNTGARALLAGGVIGQSVGIDRFDVDEDTQFMMPANSGIHIQRNEVLSYAQIPNPLRNQATREYLQQYVVLPPETQMFDIDSLEMRGVNQGNTVGVVAAGYVTLKLAQSAIERDIEIGHARTYDLRAYITVDRVQTVAVTSQIINVTVNTDINIAGLGNTRVRFVTAAPVIRGVVDVIFTIRNGQEVEAGRFAAEEKTIAFFTPVPAITVVITNQVVLQTEVQRGGNQPVRASRRGIVKHQMILPLDNDIYMKASGGVAVLEAGGFVDVVNGLYYPPRGLSRVKRVAEDAALISDTDMMLWVPARTTLAGNVPTANNRAERIRQATIEFTNPRLIPFVVAGATVAQMFDETDAYTIVFLGGANWTVYHKRRTDMTFAVHHFNEFDARYEENPNVLPANLTYTDASGNQRLLDNIWELILPEDTFIALPRGDKFRFLSEVKTTLGAPPRASDYSHLPEGAAALIPAGAELVWRGEQRVTQFSERRETVYCTCRVYTAYSYWQDTPPYDLCHDPNTYTNRSITRLPAGEQAKHNSPDKITQLCLYPGLYGHYRDWGLTDAPPPQEAWSNATGCRNCGLTLHNVVTGINSVVLTVQTGGTLRGPGYLRMGNGPNERIAFVHHSEWMSERPQLFLNSRARVVAGDNWVQNSVTLTARARFCRILTGGPDDGTPPCSDAENNFGSERRAVSVITITNLVASGAEVEGYYSSVPKRGRLDIYGYMEQRMDDGIVAEMMPQNAAEFYRDFPVGYAVAPECRRGSHLPSAPGLQQSESQCGKSIYEGLRFILEAQEVIPAPEEFQAMGAMLFQSGGLITLNSALGPQPSNCRATAVVLRSNGTIIPAGVQSGAVCPFTYSLGDIVTFGSQVDGQTITAYIGIVSLDATPQQRYEAHKIFVTSALTVFNGGYVGNNYHAAAHKVTLTQNAAIQLGQNAQLRNFKPGAKVFGNDARAFGLGIGGSDIALDEYVLVDSGNYKLQTTLESNVHAVDLIGNPYFLGEFGDVANVDSGAGLMTQPPEVQQPFTVNANTEITMLPGYLWQGYIDTSAQVVLQDNRGVIPDNFGIFSDTVTSPAAPGPYTIDATGERWPEPAARLRIYPRARELNVAGSGLETPEGVDGISPARDGELRFNATDGGASFSIVSGNVPQLNADGFWRSAFTAAFVSRERNVILPVRTEQGLRANNKRITAVGFDEATGLIRTLIYNTGTRTVMGVNVVQTPVTVNPERQFVFGNVYGESAQSFDGNELVFDNIVWGASGNPFAAGEGVNYDGGGDNDFWLQSDPARVSIFCGALPCFVNVSPLPVQLAANRVAKGKAWNFPAKANLPADWRASPIADVVNVGSAGNRRFSVAFNEVASSERRALTSPPAYLSVTSGAHLHNAVFDPAARKALTLFSDMFFFMDRAYNPVDYLPPTTIQVAGATRTVQYCLSPTCLPLQVLKFGGDFEIGGPGAIVPPFGGSSEQATREVYAARSRLMSDIFGYPALSPIYDRHRACAGPGAPTACSQMYYRNDWLPILVGMIDLQGLAVSVSTGNAKVLMPQPQAVVTDTDGRSQTIYAGSILEMSTGIVRPASPLNGDYQLFANGDAFAAIDARPAAAEPVRAWRKGGSVTFADFALSPRKVRAGSGVNQREYVFEPDGFRHQHPLNTAAPFPPRNDVFGIGSAGVMRIEQSLVFSGSGGNVDIVRNDGRMLRYPQPFVIPGLVTINANGQRVTVSPGIVSVTVAYEADYHATLKYDGSFARGNLLKPEAAQVYGDYYGGNNAFNAPVYESARQPVPYDGSVTEFDVRIPTIPVTVDLTVMPVVDINDRTYAPNPLPSLRITFTTPGFSALYTIRTNANLVNIRDSADTRIAARNITATFAAFAPTREQRVSTSAPVQVTFSAPPHGILTITNYVGTVTINGTPMRTRTGRDVVVNVFNGDARGHFVTPPNEPVQILIGTQPNDVLTPPTTFTVRAQLPARDMTISYGELGVQLSLINGAYNIYFSATVRHVFSNEEYRARFEANVTLTMGSFVGDVDIAGQGGDSHVQLSGIPVPWFGAVPAFPPLYVPVSVGGIAERVTFLPPYLANQANTPLAPPANSNIPLDNPIAYPWLQPGAHFYPLGIERENNRQQVYGVGIRRRNNETQFINLRVAHEISIPGGAPIDVFEFNSGIRYPRSANDYFQFPSGSEALILNADSNSWLAAHPYMARQQVGRTFGANTANRGAQTIPANNDGVRRINVGGMRVAHYMRSEPSPGARHASRAPVHTNVWIRLPGGGRLVARDGSNVINLPPESMVNPVLGTYLPGDDAVPESPAAIDIRSSYVSRAVMGAAVTITRRALTFPKGTPIGIGIRGGEVWGVRAAAFFSITPTQAAIDCPIGDFSPVEGITGTVAISQIREGVQEHVYEDADAERAVDLGSPCVWFDDHENNDGDRVYIYRGRRRYGIDPLKARRISNDRTYLLGGRIQLGN